MSEKFASRIVIDDCRVMLQNLVSLTDDPTSVIYNRNMFIVQATGPSFQLYIWGCFVCYAITSIRKTTYLKVHGDYRSKLVHFEAEKNNFYVKKGPSLDKYHNGRKASCFGPIFQL